MTFRVSLCGFSYLHFLLPFYWHCRHSMRAADWMRRWVRLRRTRYCLLCVCFLPRLVGFRWQATALRPWWSWPIALALPEPASPLLIWSCVDLSPIHYTYSVWFLCVLKSPVGAVCPVCCNPVFRFPTFDAFTVATVWWDWIDNSCLSMHRFGEGSTAFHTH